MNSENRNTNNDCYRTHGDNLQLPGRNRKPRLKWTKELHQHFVQAVNQLGGAHEATPRNILKLMGHQQITSNHVKSHLQKYRHSKDVYKIASIKPAKDGITMMQYEVNQQKMYGKTLEWYIHKSKDSWTFKAQNSIEGHRNFKTERESRQGEDVTAVPERILETTKAKSKEDKLHEPITCQTQTHSLCSCLTFCNLTEKNLVTCAVDAEADSGTRLSLGGVENKTKHQRENAWLAAITKDLPLYSSFTDRDGNAEEVEVQQRLASASTASAGFQVIKANARSIFMKGRTKTRAECYDNLNDLDTFSGQAGPVGALNNSKLSNFNKNGPLHSSGKSNSSSQLFDLNVSFPDEHQTKNNW